MDEDKVIEKLRNMTNDSVVPEALEPERIMESIRKKTETDVISKKGKISKTVRTAACFVSAAAALIIVFLALPGLGLSFDQSSKKADAATAVTNDLSKTADCCSYMEESAVMESAITEQTGNVDDYDEVYARLQKMYAEYKLDRIINGLPEEERIITFAPQENSASITTDSAQKDMNSVPAYAGGSMDKQGFSSTNVQTVGIDEADIIKTDGKYIYYANSNSHTVTIYSADNGSTEKISDIYIDGMGSLEEIYIDGKTLLCVGSSFREDSYNVTLVKYDISDPKKPEYITNYMQEGNSIETRKIGDVVFIVTRRTSILDVIKKEEPDTYIPKINSELVPACCIYVPEKTTNSCYTVISSVNIKDMKKIDQAAVLGFEGTFYMGTENMYLYRNEFDNETMTDIRKIEYLTDGNIGSVVSGIVPGQVRDTFAVNEYKGYLRIMTTSYNDTTSNNVFVLDSKLNVIGSIEGLAQNERIYSARYMGDTAYFVTYRETDPLFSVDLTDPYNPRIIGALKIPGFSEYLHAYGDGLLLGIGTETGDNSKSSGRVRFKEKLSMFDISNPANVTEKDKVIIEDAVYTDAWYQYKLVMIDPQKNIFGFAVNDDDGSYSYRVYSYTKNGFVEILRHELSDYQNYTDTRSVYIGNYIYIVNSSGAESYPIANVN